jgi:hypothetical protein
MPRSIMQASSSLSFQGEQMPVRVINKLGSLWGGYGSCYQAEAETEERGSARVIVKVRTAARSQQQEAGCFRQKVGLRQV